MFHCVYSDNTVKYPFWLVVWTPLKSISQLGWLFPIYGRIKKCSKPPTSISYNFQGSNPKSFVILVVRKVHFISQKKVGAKKKSYFCWQIFMVKICHPSHMPHSHSVFILNTPHLSQFAIVTRTLLSQSYVVSSPLKVCFLGCVL